jgi:hypothetical protein
MRRGYGFIEYSPIRLENMGLSTSKGGYCGSLTSNIF